MRYLIHGDDEFGIMEDCVELLVCGDHKLLTYVVDGRDVDEQLKSHPDLDQSSFSEDSTQTISSLDEFQKLVDEHFPDQDIAAWFKIGIDCCDEEECDGCNDDGDDDNLTSDL